MNREKLEKMAGAVRTGGKGSVRRCARAAQKLRYLATSFGMQRQYILSGFCIGGCYGRDALPWYRFEAIDYGNRLSGKLDS